MGTSREVRGFLRRLEDRIEELVPRDDRVSLAFSGGLTSTLLATVARKRGDLICFVAGTPDPPDAPASNAPQQDLDFPGDRASRRRQVVAGQSRGIRQV